MFETILENSLYVALAASLLWFVMVKRAVDKAALAMLIYSIAVLLVQLVFDKLCRTLQNFQMYLQRGYNYYRFETYLKDFFYKPPDVSAACFLAVFSALVYICYVYKSSRPKTVRGFSLHVPEKIMPGSQFEIVSEMPKHTFEIHVSTDGRSYFPHSAGFWADDALWTTGHSLEGYTSAILRKGDNEVEIDLSKWLINVKGDISIYPDPEQRIMSKLGLAKGKLSEMAVQEKAGPFVVIISFLKKAFGQLLPYTQFGMVIFTGSTVGGFSGAPYAFGNTIFGMHVGYTCGVNIGYDAAFLKTVRRSLRSVVLTAEDSSEWFTMQLTKKNAKPVFQRSPYNPDEWFVRVADRYHTIDDEMKQRLDEVLSDEVLRESVAKQARETYQRVKLADASKLPAAPITALTFENQGNFLRAPAVNAGAPGVVKAPHVAQLPQEPTCAATGSESQQSSVDSPTPSLTSTLAQLNVVLESISKNAANRRSLRRRRAAKPSSQLSRHINLGQQTSAPQVTNSAGSTTSSPLLLESLIREVRQDVANLTGLARQSARSSDGTVSPSIQTVSFSSDRS